MNLELKHLAPYFPYELMGYVNNKKVVLESLFKNSLSTSPKLHGFKYTEFKDFKPVLRPLFDLYLNINHNGEVLLPINILANIGGMSSCQDDINQWITNTFDYQNNGFYIESYDSGYRFDYASTDYLIVPNQLEMFQKLYEWHFDIFGLIEAGLAIDINTIKI